MRGASKLFSPQSSKGSYNNNAATGGMTKSTIEELSYHLPTNRQRPAPLSRNSTLIAAAAAANAKHLNTPKTKGRADRSRPNTGNSAFSETFMRPWSRRKVQPSSNLSKAPIMTITPASLSTSTNNLTRSQPTVINVDNDDEDPAAAPDFWVEERVIDDTDKQDIEWHPPTDWDIAGPITGGNVVAPAVPMPAFLKPTIPIDPRSIDPSSFPVPAIRESSAAAAGTIGPLGRWSSSQSSCAQGHRSSSVAGDSMFCTCDLDDIIEEEQYIPQLSGANSGSQPRKPRISMSGSSIHTRTGKCKACTRKSEMANVLAAANGLVSSPTTPLTPTFASRNSSVRKPRRKRRQESSPRSKIAVAGRLYQEG